MINDINSTYALVFGLSIILFTGLLFGKFADKIKVPRVTGYLLGGLVIGPALSGLIFPNFNGILGDDYIKALGIFAAIELGFIAFSVGTEFKVSFIKQVGAMPVVIAFAECLAAVVFIVCGMLLIGCPLPFALCMGAVGGATAPAATIMVIKQYKAKGMLSKTIMSVVALDDAFALIFFGIAMAIVKALVNPGANVGMLVAMPFIEIFGSLLLGVISGFLLTFFIRFFKSSGNRSCLVIGMIFFNIGICLLLKEVVNLGTAENPLNLGLSSLLSCMAMGAIFTNTAKEVEKVMPLIDKITPPFVIIFFVLSGADLELGAITWVALLVLAIYLIFRIGGKIFGTFVGAKACKAPKETQKWLGWGLLPQGGIAIGLSLIVMQELPTSFDPVYNGDLIRLVVIFAVFISEIFGPICLKFALIKSGEATVPENTKKRKSKKKVQVADGVGVIDNTVNIDYAVDDVAEKTTEKNQETVVSPPKVEKAKVERVKTEDKSSSKNKKEK